MFNSVAAPTVLGIDPGARQVGVSILHADGELVFFSVKTFKKPTKEESLRKLRKIISKLIIRYRVEAVAVEKIAFVQQRRSFVKDVYEEIIRYARGQENLTLCEYDPKRIRQLICGLEKPTKQNAALLLSQSYPELVRYFSVPRPWQKRYFALLFGAIAVALVCSKEIEKADITEKRKSLLIQTRND